MNIVSETENVPNIFKINEKPMLLRYLYKTDSKRKK